MIALRGIIRHVSVPTDDTSSKPNQAPPSSSGSPFDPRTTQQGEWIWTGHWAFGSLPSEEEIGQVVGSSSSSSCLQGNPSNLSALPSISNATATGPKKRGRKRSDVGIRPFVYKFEKIVEASDVMVPSSMGGESEDDDSQEGAQDRASSRSGHVESHVRSEHDDDHNKDDDLDDASLQSQKFEKKGHSRGNDETQRSLNQEKNGIQVEDVSQQKDGNDEKQSNEKHDVLIVDKLENDGKVGHHQDLTPHSMDTIDQQQQKQNEALSVKKIPSDGTPNVAVQDEHKEETKSHNSDEKQAVERMKDSNLQHKQGSSFAEVDGGVFTDAARDKYFDRCPIGGCWKGYFENISKRKDRVTSRVQESFHLFFNSTPPPDARMAFELDDNDDSTTHSSGDGEVKIRDDGALPNGYIHVRGAGTNQFGTFEIIGGFHIETGVLSCQRIYVTTTDGAGTKAGREKHKHKTRETSSPTRKSYFTRKRPYKRPGYGSDDGHKKTGVGGRKRPRISQDQPACTLTETPVKDENTSTTSVPNLSNNQASLPPTQDPSLRVQAQVTSSKTPTLKRPSSGKSLHSRRSKSSQQSDGKSNKSNNSSYIDIPKTGNPDDARWRSAHFLYYLRHAEDGSSSASPSSSSPNLITPSKTSYIVYEGEMNNGNNIRDGMGVCLYNNNMIYEGEWRNNKEHGHGSLFNGDRSQTIYVGDWERGKMHGIGTYNYYIIGNDGKLEVGGKYTGEFKENTRHGVGKYSFINGSSYEGDWRDNVPCGKGIFQWPDGSIYNGHWKDGRRNGMGKLVASDGFTYDGMWVENAMEGRGKAVYPNGQQYDGMWLNGKRDGRGTLIFGNGAVYKGRFKEDCLEGQGTLKLEKNVCVPKLTCQIDEGSESDENKMGVSNNQEQKEAIKDEKEDWMIPIEFQSDIGHIHQKAGFTTGGE